ncbi:hypothetical protein GN244_ATG08491 [Phytophthora infestans]|uniref:Uncharacterized protein n=1 Tax=Phytophthora infestans TaxID=4787 RepID=A0A833SVB3_PHYIN|nr:hypothetical protein GN244_ATG08491 [Phytophthora infestans]
MGIVNVSTNVANITNIVQDALVPTLVVPADGSLNGDLETQRNAVVTLTIIAIVRTMQSVLLDVEVLPLLADLLQYADMILRNRTAFGIANLTALESKRCFLSFGEVFLESLLRLAESQDTKCQHRAVCAIRELCGRRLVRRGLGRRARPASSSLVPTKPGDMKVRKKCWRVCVPCLSVAAMRTSRCLSLRVRCQLWWRSCAPPMPSVVILK